MKEVIVNEDTLITSKTDLKGNIIYANDDFLKYAEYSMDEILYKPHNIVRHPDMPKAVFKLLWEYIKNKEEIFAFVKNKTKSGGFYWVFANITASLNNQGETINYYSVRRAPNHKALETISKLYNDLKNIEQKHGIQASYNKLLEIVASHNVSYNQFVFELQGLN